MDTPKVISVSTIGIPKLHISFSNGVEKDYDCTPLLQMERFCMLKNEAFFKSVTVDNGGYGISWNDDIDLSEYELWTNGVEIKNLAKTY